MMDNEANNSSKNKGLIIAIIVVVLLGIVGSWYWFIYIPEQEAKEKARIEQIAKQKAAAKKKKLQQQAAKKKAKYEQLIIKADSEFEEENLPAAESSYSEALTLFPNEQYPQEQLRLINDRMNELTELEAKTVDIISAATGRYYLVISSSIDGDLAMDFGNKFAAEGQKMKIIEPYGSKFFYRVSPGDYATLDEAMAASSSFNSIDGSEIWVLKY